MTYFDIPKTARDALFQFLGLPTPAPPDHSTRSIWRTLQRSVIRRFDQTSICRRTGRVILDIGSRTRIATFQDPTVFQHLVTRPRIPAGDFSSRSDAASAEQYLADGLHIFLAKTPSDGIFVGFVEGNSLPAGWPLSLGPIFDSSGGTIAVGAHVGADVDDVVYRIIDAWS